MLKQLWMTGILTAFLVFGVKVGLGLGAQFCSKAVSRYSKYGFVVGSLFAYLLLFFAMFALITGLNLLEYLDQVARLLKYGIILHLVLALGLFYWGTKLLISIPKKQLHFPFKASLLLVIPCPVCATVILLNLTLAYALFSLSPSVTTLLLFGFFSSIILITCAITFLLNHHIKSIDTFLGMSMVAVSFYFLLTIIIAPIYPELKAAYSMALSKFQYLNIRGGLKICRMISKIRS